MDDSDEANLLYRGAYGLACRLLDGRRTSFAHGKETRWASVPILEEVLRQLGEGKDPEVIREGVEDALQGRRPRW